jgi:hypothetical protein
MMVNENKMWYKTIPQILSWIESKINQPWVWLDTETTGLGGPKKQQLTQVSAISTLYNYNINKFKEINLFDKKVKLADWVKDRYKQPSDTSRRILSFNHYGSGDYKYENEIDVINSFFEWIDNISPCFLIAQNASFDMSMLCGRYGHKITNEVFDTKMLIQLYYIPLIQKLSETDKNYQIIISNIGLSERDGGLISSSMSKIGPALGINMSGYHDALTDCRLTMKMFQSIVELLEKNKNIDISKYQNERIKIIRK